MEAVLIIFFAILTFLTRVINLLNVPIFTDEAIYIRWAQIGLNDPAHRYISLTDGKQPLLTWLMYPFLKIFSDPLYAGRLVSVLSGVFASIGIYFLARQLFGKKTAVLTTIIYIFSPFAIVYDRLALMDSLLASIGIWSLYLSVLLIKFIRLDTALLLGVTVGFGLLTKSSAFFYLYLLPFSLLLFDFKKKNRAKLLLKWGALCLLVFVIAQVMYNSLRLSPWFYIIEQKNYTFIYSWDEILKKNFSVFLPNLYGLTTFLIGYLTWPVLLLFLAGIVLSLVKKDKKILYLILYFILPFSALSLFGKVLFPRFILFMTVPIFIIVSESLLRLVKFSYKKIGKKAYLLFLILLVPGYQCFLAVTNPVEMSIPQNDRNQLFDDWPSGYGVREVISYLEKEAETKKIVIGTEGTFGLNPAVYEIYLGGSKNVEIYGFWPVSEVPEKLLEKAKTFPTYLIFKEKKVVPNDWPLRLIKEYKRGKGNTYLRFYQVENSTPQT